MPRVVHSLPGRVRLRFDGDGGLLVHALAARLGAHPSVRRVTVVSSIGSVTVHFDPTCDFHDVLGTLPAAVTPRAAVVRQVQIDWTRVVLSCLLALAPFGPIGSVAVALLTSVVEQLWEASGRRALVPAL